MNLSTMRRHYGESFVLLGLNVLGRLARSGTENPGILGMRQNLASLRSTPFAMPAQILQNGFDGDLTSIKPPLTRLDDFLVLFDGAQQALTRAAEFLK